MPGNEDREFCNVQPPDPNRNIADTNFVGKLGPIQNPSQCLPTDPPTTAPGPPDTSFSIDTSEPEYAQNYPRLDVSAFTDYCGKQPTFRLIQGVIFTLLVNHFSNSKNIVDPSLRQFTYSPDITQTGIIFNVEEDWDPQIIGRKPAVYLRRLDVAQTKLSIGDKEHFRRGPLAGDHRQMVMWEGAHSLRCFGLNSAPPDALAFEVGSMITEWSRRVGDWLSLYRFRVTGIGAKERNDRDPQDAYFAPVSVQWAFDQRWITYPVAPTIQVIDLAFFAK